MKHFGTLLLLVVGCGITDSESDELPQVGRYDYQLTFNGSTTRGDLVIEQVAGQQLDYRFYETGVFNSHNTSTHTSAGWKFVVFFPARNANTFLIRDGNTYHCTAPQVVPSIGAPGAGTCTFTYEGPDSIRLSP